jgi:hypothetical protein
LQKAISSYAFSLAKCGGGYAKTLSTHSVSPNLLRSSSQKRVSSINFIQQMKNCRSKMSAENFQYMKLADGQIRLLDLQPGHQNDPIVCRLYHFDSDSATAYEALSYNWGRIHSTRGISVQGSTFRVGENLYNALHSIRQPQASRLLWVDAICINQEDYKEKSTQIPHMGNIYAKAENVVIYLGEATRATDRTMDILIKIEESGTAQISLVEKALGVEGLRDMLSRTWFQRIWNLQDVYNAQTAIVQCGLKAVSSDTIIRASESWLGKRNTLSQHFLDMMPGSKRKDHVSKYQLHDLLQRFRQAKATISNDKIYALLDMVDTENWRTPIIPDYNQTQKHLMREVIAHLCFCELSSVPELPYDTIDDFLSNLDPIDNDIVQNIFEFSLELDLESLLRHGSHYIRIDQALVEAAGRNKTRGNEMVELLLRAMKQKRPAFPAPSAVSSVFSDISIPTTNTSYPPEVVEISALHLVEIMLTQDGFADLCRRGFHRGDLEPARFANNLRRMLKAFGKKLLDEGQSHNAYLMAKLILSHSRRFAAMIREHYDPTYERVSFQLINHNLSSMTEIERKTRIEDFTNSLQPGLADTEGTKENLDTVDDSSGSEDDPDTTLNEEPAVPSSLDEIEKFLLTSQAFKELVDSLESFLKISRDEEALPSLAVPYEVQVQSTVRAPTQTDSNKPSVIPEEFSEEKGPAVVGSSALPKVSFWLQIYDRLSDWLTRVEKPKAGLSRIQYTCVRSSPSLYGQKYIADKSGRIVGSSCFLMSTS